jgi:hypothetical protein
VNPGRPRQAHALNGLNNLVEAGLAASAPVPLRCHRASPQDGRTALIWVWS